MNLILDIFDQALEYVHINLWLHDEILNSLRLQLQLEWPLQFIILLIFLACERLIKNAFPTGHLICMCILYKELGNFFFYYNG